MHKILRLVGQVPILGITDKLPDYVVLLLVRVPIGYVLQMIAERELILFMYIDIRQPQVRQELLQEQQQFVWE